MKVAFGTTPLSAALVLSLAVAGCHQSEVLGEDAMNAGAGAGMGAGMSAGMSAGMTGGGAAGMVANNSGTSGAGMGGSGADTMSPDDMMNPDDMMPGDCAVAHVAAGGDSTCAVTVTGALYCWGRNAVTEVIDTRPERVTGIMGDVVAVSVSMGFACALVEQGYVWCWGINDHGQLGTGTSDDERAPVIVADLDDVEQIETGFNRACAIKGNGEVWCWGAHSLSAEEADIDRTPVRVWDRAEKAVQVSAGLEHVCVRDENGGVHCMGSNVYGQLGAGTDLSSEEWLTVDLVATDISAGFEHTCAIDEASDVWCWGRADEGQIGDGTTGEELSNAMVTGRPTPVRVDGVSNARAIHATAYYSCAVPWMGPTRCWGTNQFGALGYGQGEIGEVKLSPVDATALDFYLPQLAAGADHRCVVRDSGELVCWGANSYGAVGDGTLEHRFEPVSISGLACD